MDINIIKNLRSPYNNGVLEKIIYKKKKIE